MAAKNLPVVGEAFLGSDPMALKVMRIAFGFDTTDGVNDVILVADTTSGSSSQNLLTVSDSKFVIVDLGLRVVNVFSAANDIQLGVSSSPSMFLGASTASVPPLNALGYGPIRNVDTTGGANLLWPQENGLSFPQDSSDAIVVDHTTAGTNGDAELFVFYAEIP